ncbi:hypothetical protein ACFQVC_03225 [Streptomyces monticola]|uniref:Uncharacterized protein n=1 Tax=Streptomyces monticola TaxID=2666263 RepID=A0ABW2JC02_9ACTN
MQKLRVETETLTTFKKRVDILLRELEQSKAAPKHIADGVLPSGRLGNFGEAEALHSSYRRVHGELENLSKMLALQIEGLLVAAGANKTGYDNTEDGARERLSRIRSEADALFEKTRRDAGKAHGAGAADPKPKPEGPRDGIRRKVWPSRRSLVSEAAGRAYFLRHSFRAPGCGPDALPVDRPGCTIFPPHGRCPERPMKVNRPALDAFVVTCGSALLPLKWPCERCRRQEERRRPYEMRHKCMHHLLRIGASPPCGLQVRALYDD